MISRTQKHKRMNIMTKQPRNVQHPTPKKPYTPPKLVRHGDVRTLTRGGTGSQIEGPGKSPVKKP